LLDVARRIGLQDHNHEIFGLVKDVCEKADLEERGISSYTMQRAWFEQRLYNEDYLNRYFDLLARSRINSYTIIFGYENGGFLAPPYPYFFDTENFPEVKMAHITAAQQKKNISAFNKMIQLAHDRGIKITAGIWDHIYRGGVQSGGLAGNEDGAEARVEGLHSENLSAYTLKAFEKFLRIFPQIDRIQFRMHPESGLKQDEMPGFWHEVFALIAANKPGMPVDIRAKQLPDEIIDDGIDQGLNIRVTTKYWMEQMGLPFHPTHINRQNQHDRRHGYADLLQYPQRYRVHWRLWNGGTTRILLWGDPDYVRRIAQSAHLYDGNSIEFNEPLATKMETQPHHQEPFELLNPAFQHDKYEFERYWYFFDVFGRMTYHSVPPEELWNAAFKKHYGSGVGLPIRKGLHLASQVLPRIVASSYNYRYFPTTRGWAEKMHFGNLENFSRGGGTDIQQFVSFEEEAQNIMEGRDDPRVSVFETGRWFASVSDSILHFVDAAEEANGETDNNAYQSAITDLRILAGLSLYYSHRVEAAVHYNLFKKTNNIIALDDAIRSEGKAIQAWQGIVEAAGDQYAENLMMGICRMNMCGHWRTDLQQLKDEFENLKDLRTDLLKETGEAEFHIHHVPVRHLKPGNKLPVAANITANDVKSVRCAIQTGNNDYRFFEMTPDGQKVYRTEAEIPLHISTLSYYIEATNDKGEKTVFPQHGSQNPVSVLVTNDITGPDASIERIESAPTGQPLKITASVSDPSGVKWVRLRYRHVTQFEDYQSADMILDEEKNIYECEIPASFITPGWNIMYFVETMDKASNGCQYPDFRFEQPYVVVKPAR